MTTVTTLRPATARAFLLVIVLLGLYLRLHDFSGWPAGVLDDEAEAGLKASRLLHEPGHHPAFVGGIHVSYAQLGLWAAALHLGGEANVGSLRLVSVLFGTAAIGLGFLVGRRGGAGTIPSAALGLAMAFFLAVMRWSLTFSRLAITGIDSVFFVLLLVLCLLRVLEEPSTRNGVLLGLSIAGGLLFYIAFRPVLVATLAVALVAGGRRLVKPGAIALGVALVPLSPLLVFALQEPGMLMVRMREVWIGTLVPETYATLSEALLRSAITYGGMFHVEGYSFPIFNLRSLPMLDVVTGGLFLGGLVVGLVRRRTIDLLFVAVLLGGLASGALSITILSPHPGRTLPAVPAVAYFAALAVEWVVGSPGGSPGTGALSRSPFALRSLLGAAAIFVAWTNARDYRDQLRAFDAWVVTAPTPLLAELVDSRPSLGEERLLVADRSFIPRILEFVSAGAAARVTPIDVTQSLPIPVDGRPATLIVDGRQGWAVSYARTLYPKARVTRIGAEGRGLSDLPADEASRTVYWVIDVSAVEVRGAWEVRPHGLLAESFPNDTFDGPPAVSRIDATVHSYVQVAPLPRPYSVRWSGSLRVRESAAYRFGLSVNGYAELHLDGERFLVSPAEGGLPVPRGQLATSRTEGTIALAAGRHEIAILFIDEVPYSGLYVDVRPARDGSPPLPIPPLDLVPAGEWEIPPPPCTGPPAR